MLIVLSINGESIVRREYVHQVHPCIKYTIWTLYANSEGIYNMRELPVINMDQVSKEEYNMRFDTCQKCEHYSNFLPGDQEYIGDHICKECGCYMLVKCSIKEAKCPIGKW